MFADALNAGVNESEPVKWLRWLKDIDPEVSLIMVDWRRDHVDAGELVAARHRAIALGWEVKEESPLQWTLSRRRCRIGEPKRLAANTEATDMVRFGSQLNGEPKLIPRSVLAEAMFLVGKKTQEQ